MKEIPETNTDSVDRIKMNKGAKVVLLTDDQKKFVTLEKEEKWKESFLSLARRMDFRDHSVYYVEGFSVKSRVLRSQDVRELFLAYCYHSEMRQLNKLKQKFGI